MGTFFTLIVLASGFGIFYFIKKQPNKKKRNISILVMVIGFLGAGIFGETSETTKKSKEEPKVEEVDKKKKDDTAKIEKAKQEKLKAEQEKLKAEQEEKKKEEEKQKLEAEKTKKAKEEETSDITQLTGSPTDNQKIALSTLADMQFKEQYPYKGSKMHSILGVMQDWTSTDGETWFYKVEATIVNAFGAEKKSNLEVHITPNGPDSGYIEFLDY